MHRWLPLVAVLGCGQDDNAPPAQIKGLWQVHQYNTSSGVKNGEDVALARFPGCTWARQTWSFQDATLRVEHDVLCPGRRPDEYVGCQVAAEVPAQWDEAAGSWVVDTPVRARSRAVGLEPGAFGVPTSCTAEIEAGTYLVKRMVREVWRWEMRLPSGVVVRLKIPESDDPDFVMAMRRSRGAEGT